jgi:hypothetical protein
MTTEPAETAPEEEQGRFIVTDLPRFGKYYRVGRVIHSSMAQSTSYHDIAMAERDANRLLLQPVFEVAIGL